MEVRLLNSYKDESVAYKAAGICVGKYDEANEKNLVSALSRGHLSVIEHLPLTFLIKGITRACSHQLVRHRMFSYSQVSQRYTKVGDNDITDITGISSLDVDSINSIYSSYNNAFKTYNKLLGKGINREVARLVLPQLVTTDLVVSMNARALVEASQKRLCTKAQEEIRLMFMLMKEGVKDVYPNVYKLMKPNCDNCKEKNPCNKFK